MIESYVSSCGAISIRRQERGHEGLTILIVKARRYLDLLHFFRGWQIYTKASFQFRLLFPRRIEKIDPERRLGKVRCPVDRMPAAIFVQEPSYHRHLRLLGFPHYHEHMLELGWLLGYPFAIGLMILSAILPYVYFKRRGWL